MGTYFDIIVFFLMYIITVMWYINFDYYSLVSIGGITMRQLTEKEKEVYKKCLDASPAIAEGFLQNIRAVDNAFRKFKQRQKEIRQYAEEQIRAGR